jgi:short-subunit dehydrogenase
MTTVAVLGATSGIAHAALREWAARGADLRLVARDTEKLDRVRADLTVRGAGSVASHPTGLDDVDDLAGAVEWVFAEGPVDVVLISFGAMPSQEEADEDPHAAALLLRINGERNLLAAHLAALRLFGQGHGSLVVVGSVAGDRGRRSNYLYGAAKAMVATGVGGLQHRAHGTGVGVTLVKPGPTATPMTDHLRGSGLRLARAETVGHDIVRGVDAGRPVVYTPRAWRVVMAVVRNLPRPVFNRTKL